MMYDRFDIKFMEFTNTQTSSSSPDKDSERRMADSSYIELPYAEVSEKNEYNGYFNFNDTFIFIVQKNLNDNTAIQDNVYKLQFATTVADKTKGIYIIYYYHLYRISTR